MAGNKNSGRKSTYDEVTARRICEDIASGRNLSDVCRQAWAPSRATIHKWFGEHEDFRRMVDAARILGCHVIAEEIISISDEEVKDSAEASRQRTRCENRRWLVGKLYPQMFGDKVSIDVTQKGDARESEKRADERLLRESMRLGIAVNPLLIEGTAVRIRAPIAAETEHDVFTKD